MITNAVELLLVLLEVAMTSQRSLTAFKTVVYIIGGDGTQKGTAVIFEVRCHWEGHHVGAWRAWISAKKEAPVNFLTDPSNGRSTLRPADVLVFGWVGGKHACVDLTGVSPLVGLSSRGFTAGQAALKAASGKVTKHEKACIENQHVFIPFAFDTFGLLAPEAVELLSRVQRVMHSNVMKPRSTDVVFKRIGFAIQKGLAAQLVARLPFTTM
ncbi:hypothetical protein Tco_1322721 [Tanacetum coccineum]